MSLLAMSFAFGLAIFGGALAVGLRAYLVSAANQQREILDRITQESAANEVLGRLAAGEVHSLQPSRLADIHFNQRRVVIDLSLPEGKHDLRGDPDQLVLAVLEQHGLAVLGEPRPRPSSFGTLEAMSRAWRLSADEEDCLRRVATLGRAPEEFRPEAVPGGKSFTRSITAGDQVDVRIAFVTAGDAKVLWVRARFTGEVHRPWRVHDYRRLRWKSPWASCAAGK